uniref:Uncharacterized protein n=2 Tax=Physcomitrium patens TaxID=3218 RepID=A0A7I4CTZ5_PHYPA
MDFREEEKVKHELSQLEVQVETTQKEFNIKMEKYIKLLHKAFNSNIAKAYKDIIFNIYLINQIIV